MAQVAIYHSCFPQLGIICPHPPLLLAVDRSGGEPPIRKYPTLLPVLVSFAMPTNPPRGIDQCHYKEQFKDYITAAP